MMDSSLKKRRKKINLCLSLKSESPVCCSSCQEGDSSLNSACIFRYHEWKTKKCRDSSLLWLNCYLEHCTVEDFLLDLNFNESETANIQSIQFVFWLGEKKNCWLSCLYQNSCHRNQNLRCVLSGTKLGEEWMGARYQPLSPRRRCYLHVTWKRNQSTVKWANIALVILPPWLISIVVISTR